MCSEALLLPAKSTAITVMRCSPSTIDEIDTSTFQLPLVLTGVRLKSFPVELSKEKMTESKFDSEIAAVKDCTSPPMYVPLAGAVIVTDGEVVSIINDCIGLTPTRPPLSVPNAR